MERWSGKLAVVTGASVGIGADICIELVKAGMKVVGLARRSEKVEHLRNSLPGNLKSNLHGIKCDISKEEDILKAFKEIDEKFGGISVLVNNAGVLTEGTLFERENADGLRNLINVNLFGLVFSTREAYLSMKKHGITDGHVIHINSVAGHHIPYVAQIKSLNVYPASKYAVTALTEIYRQDLVRENSKIKVTSISPGLVNTEIFLNEEQKQLINLHPHLNPKDIADAVIYVLGTPPHVQVHELTIKPVGEIF